MWSDSPEVDPPEIVELDNWWVWRHRDLKRMVDGIDLEPLVAARDMWQRAAEEIGRGFAEFGARLDDLLGTAWVGESADSAAGAARPFRDWAMRMADAMEGTAARTQDAVEAVQQTKAALPEPVEFSWRRNLDAMIRGAATRGVGGPQAAALGASAAGTFDLCQQFTERENALARARQVMLTHYTAPYLAIDAGVPAFPEPPVIGRSDPHVDTRVDPQWTPYQSATGGGAPTHARPITYTPSAGYQAQPVSQPTTQQYAPPACYLPSAAAYAPTEPNITARAELTTPSTVLPGSTASTVTPGESVSPPVPGPPVGGAQSTGGPLGDYRRGAFGPPGVPPTVGPRSASGPPGQFGPTGSVGPGPVSAQASRPGSAVTPGPVGAAGAGRADEELDHRNRYLIEVDRNEIFGAGGTAAPPVIGEQQ
ncbi:PPE domain-containing protein [Actinokineospora enzanensis]|uniref:PPE domain-containing protein n=1 Tax=Actinokineospora enzanensis TaxID=155975 RepID=UPI0003792002|nr:PPE domain-containing protein [Actinokineospora enzanensis]